MLIYSLTGDGDVFLSGCLQKLSSKLFSKERSQLYRPPILWAATATSQGRFFILAKAKIQPNQNEGLFPYSFKGHGVNLGQCSGVASAPGESDKTCGVVPTMGTDLHIVQLIEMKVQSRRFWRVRILALTRENFHTTLQIQAIRWTGENKSGTI